MEFKQTYSFMNFFFLKELKLTETISITFLFKTEKTPDRGGNLFLHFPYFLLLFDAKKYQSKGHSIQQVSNSCYMNMFVESGEKRDDESIEY